MPIAQFGIAMPSMVLQYQFFFADGVSLGSIFWFEIGTEILS